MQVPICVVDKFRDRPNLTPIDRLVVNGCHRHNASSRGANKDLICLEGHLNRDNLNVGTDTVLLCNFQDGLASDTLQHAAIGCIQGTIFDDHDVITGSFGQVRVPVRETVTLKIQVIQALGPS